MLRNDNYIIKNDDNIFKSQIVETYLKTNTTGGIQLSVYSTGLDANNPVSVYYQTPTAVLKTTATSGSFLYSSFDGTSESSCKNIYFCGALNRVTCVCATQSLTNGCFGGNLVCYVNQFPNIKSFCFNRETAFNQNISNAHFPETLTNFPIFDKCIQGNIGTVSGLENVQCWKICCTMNLTGNLHNITTNSVVQTCIYNTPSGLAVNLNCLVNNNPNHVCSWLQFVNGVSMCADTIDISNMCNMYWYIPVSNVKGNFSGWTFNDNMVCFDITTCCVNGNISNWDISNTNMLNFSIQNQGYTTANICGDLFTSGIPSTFRCLNLSYTRGITSIPTDYSHTQLYGINLTCIPALSGDITTYNFPSSTMRCIVLNATNLCGNLENFLFTTGYTGVQLRGGRYTGNLANIKFSSTTINNIYLDCACLSGNIADFTYPNSVSTLSISSHPNVYLDITSKTFNTQSLSSLYLCFLSGITGSFNNLTVGSQLRVFNTYRTNVYSDLNQLNLNQITNLEMYCSNMCQDITNKFTGTTNITTLNLQYNCKLSGDTSNWNVNNMAYLYLNCTALSGRLKHTCPYWMCISNTNICSCIDVDFDLSKRGYYMFLNNAKLQGNLSGVTLNYNCMYYFSVYGNPNLYGADSFACYLFINRKNFTGSYLTFYWYSIGDTVVGVSETLGSLGSWSGSPWDLTEEQVNNLVAGTDYTGTGSSTPWDSKNKMYWMKNALVSSSSTSKRYSCYQLLYT